MANRLATETSPYLLQHANNPVSWYPWGPEALEKAKNEDKLILVSIGYAACHWCHVMEHESFEDEEVATLMNQHFINIKIDREERPDIDKVYMDAVQLMTGRGGWPLNCIALPDGRPIWGGTYFPKDHWMNALSQIAEMYQNDKARVLESAKGITDYMQDLGKLSKAEEINDYDQEHLEYVLLTWMKEIDEKWGGRKVSANKFPLPVNNQFLLRAAYFSGQEKVQEAVTNTLNKMAFGGIYDHLGGGFARYSVDQFWKVPHFEKMLYDNSQLTSLYAEAYQYLGEDHYRSVVYESLAFVKRELTAPNGGFYSSLDADSEGVEGKFYVWEYDELISILGEEAKLFADYYNVHPFGNWEGKNILFVLETEKEFASRWKLDPDDFSRRMKAGRDKLLAARASRIRPGLDDKILTSWNALMLIGCLDAFRVFGEQEFLDMALKNANFLKNEMTEGGMVYRNFKLVDGKGIRSIPGFLDDYAHLISAYIKLYEVSFDDSWLTAAKNHWEYVQSNFFDPESGMFFYTSDQGESLVKRHIESQDDVIPSSNAMMAHNLFRLYLLTHDHSLKEIYQQMMANVRENFLQSPAWHAKWGQLVLAHLFPHYEVAITGPDALKLSHEFGVKYYPNTIMAGSNAESELPILQHRFTGENTFYVCQGNTCQLPVHTVEEAWEQMGIREE